jgi:hypothetical protein
MYRLTVEKFSENPNFELEKKRYQGEQQFYNSTGPSEYFLSKALTVELTDAEFQLVKKAVVEIM